MIPLANKDGKNIIKKGDSSGLGYLPNIESVSGLIPIIPDFSLAELARQFFSYAEVQMNVAIRTGVVSPAFPNARGNIDYYFHKPQFGIVIGGDIREETALRLIFFVAHGLGHALQHLDPENRRHFDTFIHSSSKNVGSRQMEDLIRCDDQVLPFKKLFTLHEREATRIGWLIIEDYMVKHSLKSHVEEIRFWYSLFGMVDHLYHRQSITGPFSSSSVEWMRLFGRKFESILIPYSLSAWDTPHNENFGDVLSFDCVHVGTDGWFYWASDEIKAGLSQLRNLFFEKIIDPFPRLNMPTEVLRLPGGDEFDVEAYNSKRLREDGCEEYQLGG